MRKIAVVKCCAFDCGCDNAYEENRIIAQSISEWQEVSDEQYALLQKSLPHYAAKLGHTKFVLVEFPDQKDVIENSINFYLQKIENEKKEREKWESKHKKESEAKKKERELKQLEKLKAKYGK